MLMTLPDENKRIRLYTQLSKKATKWQQASANDKQRINLVKSLQKHCSVCSAGWFADNHFKHLGNNFNDRFIATQPSISSIFAYMH